jgi:hypothetical protein
MPLSVNAIAEIEAVLRQLTAAPDPVSSCSDTRISTMEGADIVESPRKRLKTEDTADTADLDDAVLPPSTVPALEAESAKLSDGDAQALKEVEVGITEFVSADNVGFSGVLKKRYGSNLRY